jgi:hypothetical protein
MQCCRWYLDRWLFIMSVSSPGSYLCSSSSTCTNCDAHTTAYADFYSGADSYPKSRTCTSTSSNRCAGTYHSPSTNSDSHNWIRLLQFAKCWKGVYMYSIVLHG